MELDVWALKGQTDRIPTVERTAFAFIYVLFDMVMGKFFCPHV
jgi:hypothetical protein